MASNAAIGVNAVKASVGTLKTLGLAGNSALKLGSLENMVNEMQAHFNRLVELVRGLSHDLVS